MKALLRRLAATTARTIFAIYGLWSLFRRPRLDLPLPASSIRRVLVIRLDLMGDAVFSAPAVEAVARHFPNAEIDVLALPYTAPLVRAIPVVHHVYELDVNAYRRLLGLGRLGALFRTVQALRKRDYDLVISLSRLVGGIFAGLSGGRWRAGAAQETYWGCYNLPSPGRRYAPGQHEVDYCLALVGWVAEQVLGTQWGGPESPERGIPVLSATRFFGATAVELGQSPYVVVVPGASNGTAKQWPIVYWAELADRLGAECGVEVTLCGGNEERGLAEAFKSLAKRPVRDLIGQTSVSELARIVAGAAVVVAGDTGPLHLAVSLGRPTVGIYGATDPVNTGPLGDRSRVLRAGLACSPCYDLRSPAECKLPDRSVACMWKVSPAEVYAAVATVLKDREAFAGGASLVEAV
ncbi:MAG: glycosyltransferase family 9 protein [Chloroflexi bacterium]|nr:glycosyltransferase family 9 protein [Chloroflexota bacterium]